MSDDVQSNKAPLQLSPLPTTLVSKAPKIGEATEQWVTTMKFSCVRCHAAYISRALLLKHYEDTRHDKYSAWEEWARPAPPTTEA
jgi:hypothetical protein